MPWKLRIRAFCAWPCICLAAAVYALAMIPWNMGRSLLGLPTSIDVHFNEEGDR